MFIAEHLDSKPLKEKPRLWKSTKVSLTICVVPLYLKYSWSQVSEDIVSPPYAPVHGVIEKEKLLCSWSLVTNTCWLIGKNS